MCLKLVTSTERSHARNAHEQIQKIYTGCPGRNVPDFGIMFLKLKYADITENTYIRSSTGTEIKVREKCVLLAVPHTVPGSRDVLLVHCACPSLSTAGSSAFTL